MSSRLMLLVALFGLLALSQTAPSPAEWQWKLFKAEYSKTYSSTAEELLRMKIFADNVIIVAEHNKLYEAGVVSFEMGINQFSDMLTSEVTSTMNGSRMPNGTIEATPESTATFVGLDATAPLPKSVDWRTKGLVTPVKNQGNCGSCWAFSATGSLEGQHAKKTGKLVSLSEQQLLDCSGSFGNEGCKGGWINAAFKYVIQAGGIDTEQSYGYQGKDGKCAFVKSKVGTKETGFVNVKARFEDALQQAVANVGPVSVFIDAGNPSFVKYKSGVYYEEDCFTDPQWLDHCVLVVGYGVENGTDYWLVKNSWGTSWGEEGYIKMTRNRRNNCGIATEASYPLL